MALFHFHVTQVKRSAGQSAVACSAYRAGEKLVSEYYGETNDFTHKGGVGKSTTVYNLGAGLAMDGKKVLMLDVDPQGDLTKMLSQRKPHDLPLTLANAMSDVVAGTMPRDHPEIMHHHEGFDFVPGNRSLSAVEVSLVNVMSRETVLRQYVDSVKRDYDYVLLDCRPSLGMLVINALSASDYVLIPVQTDYLAAEDMTELVGTVRNIQRQINPKLKIGGVFLTMANETNFRKDIVAAVKSNFGKHLPVMDAVIPATVRLAEISTAHRKGHRENRPAHIKNRHQDRRSYGKGGAENGPGHRQGR